VLLEPQRVRVFGDGSHDGIWNSVGRSRADLQLDLNIHTNERDQVLGDLGGNSVGIARDALRVERLDTEEPPHFLGRLRCLRRWSCGFAAAITSERAQTDLYPAF